MKLSATQRQTLEVVALRKQRLEDEQRAAEYVVRAEVAQRTAASRAEYERAVVEADLAGIPKAQIALAVGTTNPKPIREILRRASSARRATLSGRFARGATNDILLVHLDGDDLVSACDSTGWSPAEAVRSGVDRAEFKVVGGSVLVSETPSFVTEVGRLNPTVAWVRRIGSAEALAWWREAS